jgi:hypothetical protein
MTAHEAKPVGKADKTAGGARRDFTKHLFLKDSTKAACTLLKPEGIGKRVPRQP